MLGCQKSAPGPNPLSAQCCCCSLQVGAFRSDIPLLIDNNEKSPHQRAFCVGKNLDQPKFFSANDQFTKLLRKVSTNLGRMLR